MAGGLVRTCIEPHPLWRPPLDNRVSSLSQETQSQIAAALAGDQSAMAWLATRYAPFAQQTALRYVDREEAKDLAHDALIKVLTQLHRYKNEWKFSTWVITITRNTCIDWLRKQRRTSWSEVPDVACLQPLPDEATHQKQISGLVHAALESLPEMYREVIEMHHFQNLKYREIAENLDIPIGTVMNRIFRAREKMRDAMMRPAA